jgi:hypothetical protein
MAAVALDACGGAQSDLVGKFTCAICLGVLVRFGPAERCARVPRR